MLANENQINANDVEIRPKAKENDVDTRGKLNQYGKGISEQLEAVGARIGVADGMHKAAEVQNPINDSSCVFAGAKIERMYVICRMVVEVRTARR